MSTTLTLESSMEASDVSELLRLIERLDDTGNASDSRTTLTDASLLYGSLGTELHLSLLGRFEYASFAITITHTDWKTLLAIFQVAVCENFKVGDAQIWC